jgi:hypothetical protein
MRFWQSLSFTGAEDLVTLGTKAEEVGFTGVAFAELDTMARFSEEFIEPLG